MNSSISKRSKMSVGSGSDQSSFLKRTEFVLYDTLSTIADSMPNRNKYWKFFRYSLCFSWMAQCIFLVSSRFFDDFGFSDGYGYALVLVNPMKMLSFHIYAFVAVYIVFTIVIWVPIFILVYMMLERNASNTLARICYVSFKVIRYALYIPMCCVVMGIFNCDFWSAQKAFTWGYFPSNQCIVFPYVIFQVLAPVNLLGIFVTLTLDSLFMLEKLNSFSSLLACSTGRFNLLTNYVVFFYVFISGFLSGLKHAHVYVNLISSIVLSVIFFVFLRIVPYYSKVFVNLCSQFFALLVSISFSSAFVHLVEDRMNYLVLLCYPFIAIIFWILTVIRYKIIRSIFKKGIKKNFLFCTTSHDFTLAIYRTRYDNKRAAITKIISNTRIQKTKDMCQNLIGLLFQDDIKMALRILKHSDGIRQKCWYDTTFILLFYKRRIAELQLAGKGGGGEDNRLDIIKRLKKLRVQEKALKKIYLKILEKLLEEKFGFESFPGLLTTFQDHMEFCDKNYKKLLAISPTPTVLRRYGDYLLKFKNDRDGSKHYFNEAKFLDETNLRTGGQRRPENDQSTPQRFIEMNPPRTPKVLPFQSPMNKVKRISEMRERGTPKSPFRDFINSMKQDLSLTSPTRRDMGDNMSSVSGGSYMSSMTARTVQNEYVMMREKTEQNTIFTSYLVYIGLFLLFVCVVGCIIGNFFVLYSFNQENILFKDRVNQLTGLRIDFASIPYNARKFQISKYSKNETILDEYRNSTKFYNDLNHTCIRCLKNVMELYSKTLHNGWRDFLTVTEIKGGVAYYQNISIIDGSSLYLTKCLGLLEKINATKDISKLKENQDFYFLVKNEGAVYNGLEKILENVIAYESVQGDQFWYLLIVVVSICESMAVLFFVLFLILTCQFQWNLKGFLLLEKTHVLDKYEKIGGNNVGQNNEESGPPSTTSGGSTKMPMIRKFFFTVLVYIVICTCILAIFVVIYYIMLSQYKTRNIEIDYSSKMSVDVRKLHYYTLEFLYHDDSVFDEQTIHESFEHLIETIQSNYQKLKFGSKDVGLTGLDYRDAFRGILYNEICSVAPSMSESEKLYCLSLNRKMFEYIEKAEDLAVIISDHNVTEAQIIAARASPALISMNLLDEGRIIHDHIFKLVSWVGNEGGVFIQILYNGAILFTIFGLPIFIVLFFYLFAKYPRRMNFHLNVVKNIIFLFPREVAMRPEIFNWLEGKSTFQKSYKESKKLQKSEFLEMMKMSSYILISFDHKGRVIYYNDVAGDLFKLMFGNPRLSSFLSESSAERVEKWIRKGGTQPLQGELVAVYNGMEFPIICDISRKGKIFFAIFENVQDAKKKQILEIAEKKSEKTEKLLANILPLEIAKKIKLKDSNCYKIVDVHKQVTAVFADIVNFTTLSKSYEPEEFIGILSDLFAGFDDLTEKFQIEKIKTIGDCYFYVPIHAENAMKFSIAMLEYMENFRTERKLDMHIRVGMSSGKAVAGVIGKKKFCYDIWGDCVNEASRMESKGLTDKIQVSRATYEYLFDKFQFLEREINIQGIGRTKVYIHKPIFKKKEEEEEEIGDITPLTPNIKSPKHHITNQTPLDYDKETKTTTEEIEVINENEKIDHQKQKQIESNDEFTPKKKTKKGDKKGDKKSLGHSDSGTFKNLPKVSKDFVNIFPQ